MRRIPLLAALLLSFAATGVANAAWIGTWGASPTAPSPARGPFPASPSYENQTIRQIVRISAGGQRLRVVLTNAYGDKSLAIGAVHVALAGENGAIQPGTDHVVTFNGGVLGRDPRRRAPGQRPDRPARPGPDEPRGQHLPAGRDGALHLPWHRRADGLCGGRGCDGAAAMPADAAKIQFRAFLSGVEVDAAPGSKTIVAFGDSITDGLGSTTDANHAGPTSWLTVWPPAAARPSASSMRASAATACCTTARATAP